MKVLDLFSGIGGFSLGLERAGMETVAFCEIEEYPRKVLAKHWPDVPIYEDVRALTAEKLAEDGIDDVGLICGGFPCQPFSVAGKQRGKEDNRHLWPEMLRIIKEVRPAWVIGENVAGFIRMALDDVLLDLETEGYTTQSFVIPACGVGAIHRRDRVWVVGHATRELSHRSGAVTEQARREKPTDTGGKRISGYTKHNGRNGSENGQSDSQGNDRDEEGQDKAGELEGSGGSGRNDADTVKPRLEGLAWHEQDEREGQKPDRPTTKTDFSRNWEPVGLPTEPPIRHRDDGLPDNVARLKALGNAVVPQIPEIIGRAIMEQAKE